MIQIKRYLLLFLFFIVSYESLSAREKFGLDLNIGLKAGLNFNRISGKGWDEVYKTNPHAGLFVYLNKRRIGIHIETVFSQSSMTTDTSFYGLYKQYYNNAIDSLNVGSFRFQTISIPILVNLKVTQFLWLQVGPQYNANVSVIDRRQLLKTGLDIISQNSYDVVSGLWLQLGSKKSPLFKVNAGLRYIWGISNLNNVLRSNAWNNQSVQLHIGINY